MLNSERSIANKNCSCRLQLKRRYILHKILYNLKKFLSIKKKKKIIIKEI